MCARTCTHMCVRARACLCVCECVFVCVCVCLSVCLCVRERERGGGGWGRGGERERVEAKVSIQPPKVNRLFMCAMGRLSVSRLHRPLQQNCDLPPSLPPSLLNSPSPPPPPPPPPSPLQQKLGGGQYSVAEPGPACGLVWKQSSTLVYASPPSVSNLASQSVLSRFHT